MAGNKVDIRYKQKEIKTVGFALLARQKHPMVLANVHHIRLQHVQGAKEDSLAELLEQHLLQIDTHQHLTLGRANIALWIGRTRLLVDEDFATRVGLARYENLYKKGNQY